MEEDKYYQLFKALDIPVEPLSTNYTPEEYGRKLLSMSRLNNGVSYAASTDYMSATVQKKNE